MKTVLYVDDNDEMIELVNIVLENSGYRVVSLSEGRTTLSFCTDENPELVLMDLKMPDMDGFETIRKLREQGFTNPIVVLSALNSDEDRKKAEAAGCDDFVVKDMLMSGLEDIIDKHIADSGGV